MKKLLLIIPTCLLAGCAYTAKQYALQPGEEVRFESAARANEYRIMSGNDRWNTNCPAVKITRPCSVTCE